MYSSLLKMKLSKEFTNIKTIQGVSSVLGAPHFFQTPYATQ